MHPTAAEMKALAQRDPKLASAMGKVPAFPGFPTPDRARGSHFQAIARSIVYQQLAGSAASAIHARACTLGPGPRFPTPTACQTISEGDFRAAGLSAAKTRAIKDLAAKCLDGTVRLRSVARRSDEDIIEMLCQVSVAGS